MDKPTVLIQGITGKEGQRGLKHMLAYNTSVLCGVTPGKGGQEIDGVPVFNSVAEAVKKFPAVTTSVLYVPPRFVKGAALEAMRSGIKQILIFAENVPIQDATIIIETARKQGVSVIGPSSVGVIRVGEWRLGSIGGSTPNHAFSKGNVAILSKSGGMCSETALMLTLAGIGQSVVFGVGGDVIIGTTFADLAEELENDPETKAIVLCAEMGGSYEEQFAEAVKTGKLTKPVVAFVCGVFAESIDRELAFGHAGAIIEGGKGTAREKKKILESAGITVVDYHHEIVEKLKEIL